MQEMSKEVFGFSYDCDLDKIKDIQTSMGKSRVQWSLSPCQVWKKKCFNASQPQFFWQQHIHKVLSFEYQSDKTK